jgi:hypothetical protein
VSAPGAPPSDAPPPVVDEAKKVEAKAHFDKGWALFQQNAAAAALAEFFISREIFPTRVATSYAGAALKKLQRFDESLDMYEALLREFPNMPAGARAEAQRALAEMRELVGTIEIKGAEPGAAIVISGQARGEYPPITPLRVSAGAHVVRLLKDGFEPFEVKVDVAGGLTSPVVVKLRPLVDSGRLRVIERNGRKLDVVIGGAVKGQTPWEGVLPVADVAVMLRGKGGLEGTAPAVVTIKSKQLSTLTLIAEELDAPLRVTPVPESAEVVIDGVRIGGGIWTGRLKSGVHHIGAAANGYVPEVRDVKLERGRVANLAFKLEVDSSSPLWRKPSHRVFDVEAGFVVVLPSLGGPVGGCSNCSASLGKGVLGTFRGGYELGNGFGFGLSAGYLFLAESVTGRPEKLYPMGFDPTSFESGTAADDLRLSAFLGGAYASYHYGESVPFLMRLGIGGLVGQLRDERNGTFKPVNGPASGAVPVDAAVTRAMAASLYVSAALRVGVHLGNHVDLSAGVEGLVLITPKPPVWDKSIQLKAGGKPPVDGVGSYNDDTMMGSVVFGLVPQASLRYAF